MGPLSVGIRPVSACSILALLIVGQWQDCGCLVGIRCSADDGGDASGGTLTCSRAHYAQSGYPTWRGDPSLNAAASSWLSLTLINIKSLDSI